MRRGVRASNARDEKEPPERLALLGPGRPLVTTGLGESQSPWPLVIEAAPVERVRLSGTADTPLGVLGLSASRPFTAVLTVGAWVSRLFDAADRGASPRVLRPPNGLSELPERCAGRLPVAGVELSCIRLGV